MTDEKKQELLAKLQECKTPQEVLALVQAEGLELPEEQLEKISGGIEDFGWDPITCPSCGSSNYKIEADFETWTPWVTCNKCGHRWTAKK